MAFTTPVKSSAVELKVGIQRAGLGSSKRLIFQDPSLDISTYDYFLQALEFGEIKQMADKAGLFKSVIRAVSIRVFFALRVFTLGQIYREVNWF